MRTLLLTLAVFLALALTAASIGFLVLIDPGPQGRLAYLERSARLLLHRHGLVSDLSQAEIEAVYRSTCTRKCHGRDVIEKTPRTAMEWEMIVQRMKQAVRAGVRADITEPEARTVVTHLQRNFLSNVPTVMPPKIMAFMKKHLWRIDFGERDIYLDVIYMPLRQRYLAPYIARTQSPLTGADTQFVLYINTHQGVLPGWDLTHLATLDDGRGAPLNSHRWQVLYEDNDKHHRQGILSFPPLRGQGEKPRTLEMTLKLPNMRKRVFQWFLPIPELEENVE